MYIACVCQLEKLILKSSFISKQFFLLLWLQFLYHDYFRSWLIFVMSILVEYFRLWFIFALIICCRLIRILRPESYRIPYSFIFSSGCPGSFFARTCSKYHASPPSYSTPPPPTIRIGEYFTYYHVSNVKIKFY